LEDYIIVYFNNVLIYKVLQRLRDISFNLDFKKYTFTVKEVKYLGYIVEIG
ncbi:uncharacterized protein THITE_2016962, partial [Thermothielavioides terrestris NRRL 8126]